MAKNFPNYIEEDYSDINALKRIIEEHQIEHIIPRYNDHSYKVCATLSNKNYALNIDDIAKRILCFPICSL